MEGRIINIQNIQNVIIVMSTSNIKHLGKEEKCINSQNGISLITHTQK